MSTERRGRAWIDVDGAALRRNLLTLRERAGPDVDLIPMVKADGYGLGMDRVVQALRPVDPAAFGVATVDEGEALRATGEERTILVFSPLPPGTAERAVLRELTPCVSDLGTLDRLRDAGEAHGREVPFHLEVDTGMGRAGFDWRRVDAWGSEVAARSSVGALRWRGVFTHFHSADEADPEPTREQWRRFRQTLDALPVEAGELTVHACNSAAALRMPELAADAVRPGIFLYGGAVGPGAPRPDPVASVRARVVLVRDATAGTTLGYGATHTADAPERWATVAIGYGDGLPRLLSNRGHGLVHGRRVPIVGRISMDVTVVDISGVDGVEPGDVVTFVGRDGDEEITLEEVAGIAGTISYEILTDLTPRLPRIWNEDAGGRDD